MRTVIMILAGLATIALGITAIAKRSITFGIFPPLDTQQHKGAGAIILGVILILVGLGLIIGEIVALATAKG